MPQRKRTRFLIECACGCGTIIETPDRYNRERRFCKGHHPRIQRAGQYAEHLQKANEQKKVRHSVVDGIEGKICSTCKEWKSLEEFYKSKTASDKLENRCKVCQRKRALSYYHSNSEEIAEKRKTPQFREQFNAYYAKYTKNRKKTDVSYRLKKALRGGLYQALKKRKKGKRTLELLGCSVDGLRMHLQEQFLPGMTWANWGQPGWEIDHIIPIAAFDLSRPEHQEQCFHYTNLQPLWGEDNLRKGDYVPERMKPH